MNPKCHFGHNCYWPSAGPMGEYNCESNLFDLGKSLKSYTDYQVYNE